MKNLYSYRNTIASGLKRYSKFLLLALSFFMLGSTAWAAAPSQMFIWYCGHETNQWSESNLTSEEMTSIGTNKWSYDLNISLKDYQFFFATKNSKSNIIVESSLTLVDFTPSCATNTTQIEGYNLSQKNNAGRLHMGHEKGECPITIIVTYESDTKYIIQVDSPCVEEGTEPQVTTGNGYLNDGKLVVSDNVLNELYKDGFCNRNLEGMGVEIFNANDNVIGTYEFVLTSGDEWINWRRQKFTITTEVEVTSKTCYRAYAYYGEHRGVGEKKCISPAVTPGEKTPIIRIGKQPVVDGYSVDMNFQLAWGCSKVTEVRVYYTTDGTEPTTSSYYWTFDTNFSENTNFTRLKEGLAIGSYKIKASAYNSLGWSELSDMAMFDINCVDPNPSTPNISLDKSTICASETATVTVNNIEEGVSYKLYKINGETTLVSETLTDGKFIGIDESGNYAVKAINNCGIESISQTISLIVIEVTGVTINPTEATTTPWVPVNFTVSSSTGIPYNLECLDSEDNDVTESMVIHQEKDSYSLKIPRPADWGPVNGEPNNAKYDPTTYIVNVVQKAGDTECASQSLTITLEDTFDNCD